MDYEMAMVDKVDLPILELSKALLGVARLEDITNIKWHLLDRDVVFGGHSYRVDGAVIFHGDGTNTEFYHQPNGNVFSVLWFDDTHYDCASPYTYDTSISFEYFRDLADSAHKFVEEERAEEEAFKDYGAGI